jgi:hypothetical protein
MVTIPIFGFTRSIDKATLVNREFWPFNFQRH